jgi:hypothetical protein
VGRGRTASRCEWDGRPAVGKKMESIDSNFYPLSSHINLCDKGHFGPFTGQKNAK